MTSCFCWARPLRFSAGPTKMRWDSLKSLRRMGEQMSSSFLTMWTSGEPAELGPEQKHHTLRRITSSSLVHNTGLSQSGSEYLGVGSLSHRLTDLRDPIQNHVLLMNPAPGMSCRKHIMCICMYMYIYIYIYIHTHTHTHYI